MPWDDVVSPLSTVPADLAPEEYENRREIAARWSAAVERVKSLAIALNREPHFFVSGLGAESPEEIQAATLWMFAEDLALRTSITGDGFAIAIYKPSRDFERVEVQESGDILKDLVIRVYMHAAHENPIELRAQDSDRNGAFDRNSDVLYGALPYILAVGSSRQMESAHARSFEPLRHG